MPKLSQIVAAGAAPVSGTQFVAVTGGGTDNLYTIDQIATFSVPSTITTSVTGTSFTPGLDISQTINTSNPATTFPSLLRFDMTRTSDNVLYPSQIWQAYNNGTYVGGMQFDGSMFANSFAGGAVNARSGAADFTIKPFFGGMWIIAPGSSLLVGKSGWGLSSSNILGWYASTDPSSSVIDTQFYRDAAGTVAIRNGANAQTFRVYNTVDAIPTTTNYERGTFDWTTTANVLTIGGQKGGTGSGRYLQITDSVIGNFIGSARAFGVDGFANMQNGIIISGGGQAGIGTANGNAPTLAWSGPTAVLSIGTINSGANGAWFNYGGQARVNADFSVTSSTALTNVTGLSVTLQSSRHYQFEAVLLCTDAAAGGVQAAMSGTATVTNIIYEGFTLDANTVKGQTQATALGTAVGSTTTTGTTPTIRIQGLINTNAGGTLTVQFAQNTSNATASVVKQGSYLIVQDIN